MFSLNLKESRPTQSKHVESKLKDFFFKVELFYKENDFVTSGM